MTRQEFEDLKEWVKNTENDLSLLEKAVAEMATEQRAVKDKIKDVGDIPVIRTTQKFQGWMFGLLMTANLALLAFILNKLYELSLHIK